MFVALNYTSSASEFNFSSQLDIELEGQTDRNQERIVSVYSSQMNLQAHPITWRSLSIGASLTFSHEFEHDEEAVARFHSYGLLALYKTNLPYEIKFVTSYTYQLIQDKDLNQKYKLDGYHQSQIEFQKIVSDKWYITINAQATHFVGGLPEFRSSPNNAIKLSLDNTYKSKRYSVGLEVSREQESVIRETQRTNVVFDKLLLRPHIGFIFSQIELELFTVLDPFRSNYKKIWAYDTFKQANYGMTLTTSLRLLQ